MLVLCFSLALPATAGLLFPGCEEGVKEQPPRERRQEQQPIARVLHLLHRGRRAEARALLAGVGDKITEGSGQDKGALVQGLLCRASLLEQEDRLEEAEQYLLEAHAALSGMPGSYGKKAGVILVHRARILAKLGETEAANACLEAALEEVRGTKGGARLETLILREQEKLLHLSGDYEKELRKAIRQSEKAFGPDHLFMARGLYRLALLMEEKGRIAEAEKYYLRSMEIHEEVLGPLHPVMATFYTHLAAMFRNAGEYEKAKPYLMKAIRIYENTLQETEPERIEALKAMMQRAQVDVTPVVEALIRFEEKNFGPDHPNVARSLRYQAMFYESTRRYEEAEPMIRRALRIYRKRFPPGNPEVLLTRKRLAACLFAQGKVGEAVRLAEETLEIERRKYGRGHPATMPSVFVLAEYLQGAGRYQEAEEHYRLVLEYAKAREEPGAELLRAVASKLVEVCLAQGKKDEVASLRRLFLEGRDLAPGGTARSSRCPRGREAHAGGAAEQSRPSNTP